MNKREFLKASSLIGISSLANFSALGRMIDNAPHLPAGLAADGEDYWALVRAGYRLESDYINLENGYYNIMPVQVQERYLEHTRNINLQGAYYMRILQEDNKRRVAGKLAELAGCSTDELIITRNTTESLDMIIAGLDWKRGDEAVMAEQDYGAMLNMFHQVGRRYGVVNKVLSVPKHPESDEEIVKLYADAITKKTRLLMICHMINITGHILPVRKICDMAHERGVLVMVDGAHTFAHLNFKVPDLHADFYGCSLHKWLSSPLGAGMLYVKSEHVRKIWPLLAEDKMPDDTILRLNHTGTHPVAAHLAIEDAIDYYNHMGAQRKEDRLRYLQQYWTTQVRHLPDVILNTSADPQRACAIANVGVKNMQPADMAKRLLEEYRIYTVAINNAGVQGCRITPNLFTTTDELDTFVSAIKEMSAG